MTQERITYERLVEIAFCGNITDRKQSQETAKKIWQWLQPEILSAETTTHGYTVNGMDEALPQDTTHEVTDGYHCSTCGQTKGIHIPPCDGTVKTARNEKYRNDDTRVQMIAGKIENYCDNFRKNHGPCVYSAPNYHKCAKEILEGLDEIYKGNLK
jgi:hypothetical protein